MVQSPSWEANWCAASQEIPRISRNPKVHYRSHNRPPSVSILCQPNLVHIPTSYLLEIHPNIIHPSRRRPPQWSPSLRFPHQDPIHPLSSPIRATCPAHLILLDFITRTILGEEYKSFGSSLCSLLSTHLRLGLPSGLFPSGLPTKTLYTPSPRPYAPHAQPISFFSILSPAQSQILYTVHKHLHTFMLGFRRTIRKRNTAKPERQRNIRLSKCGAKPTPGKRGKISSVSRC